MIYSNYGTDYSNLDNAFDEMEFDKNEYSDISEDEVYNKIQKLLECDEMEDAHDFLYGINMDELTDDIVSKVNDLYDLAVERGFIALNDQKQETEQTTPDWLPEENDVPETISVQADSTYIKDSTDNSGAIDSAYSVLYSATKDGEIKTGECYSNAIDTKSAKVDAISKLANLGFDNIEIFAVEFGNRPKEEPVKNPEIPTENPEENSEDPNDDWDNPDDEFQEYA